MGSLTGYLQEQFRAHCPTGWSCSAEQSLLSEEMSDLLGYQSRADVRLSRNDGSRHLWIEFEISRADPVANHAKYGTACIFAPRGPEHAFVSMVSSHITRGRANLAAASIYLLRRTGVQAFQTSLFPHVGPKEIKAFNGQDKSILSGEKRLDVGPEIERSIAISAPVLHQYQHRIYFASNTLEVLLNARRWNAQMQEHGLRNLWGKRTVTYFVSDPFSHQFAPSKFCGFISSGMLGQGLQGEVSCSPGVELMGVSDYAALDESESRFDGHLARNHLVRRLGFKEIREFDASDVLRKAFARWLADCDGSIRVHKKGATLLLAP